MERMSVRILSNGRSFVRRLELPVIRDRNGRTFLPLMKGQVDTTSIQLASPAREEMSYIIESMSRVMKGDRVFEGVLMERGDRVATIDQGLYKMSIKGWDQVEEPRYVEISGIIGDRVIGSFITTGISGNVVHRLHLNHQTRLDTDLMIENRTPIELQDVGVEVMTAEEKRMFRSQVLEMASEPATANASQGESGTIYTLEGTYDIPSNMKITLSMFSSVLASDRVKNYYIIDPGNDGYMVQATQIISLTPSMDLPSGSLYVYRNGRLEASTYLPATGEDQEREIPLLQIPSIFSTGTIEIDTMEKQDQETGINMDTITLNGTITNRLPIQVMVYLRYRVGTARVVPRGNSRGPSWKRQGPYLLFPHSMGPRSTQDYSYTFTIRH